MKTNRACRQAGIFLPILILICISWSMSNGAIYHRYLGNLQTVEVINVCAGANDTVIIHKPSIAVTFITWLTPDWNWIYNQDTVIVTYNTQGNWFFSSGEAGNDFYVYFIQDPPYQPACMAHDSVFAYGSTINWTLDAQNLTMGYSCSYLWDDSSASRYRTITDTGTYWVRLTNDCGTRTDTLHVRIATTTGITEAGINTFSFYVFPNPSSTGIFQIEGENISQVEVMDNFGRVLFTTSSKKVDLSMCSAGIYNARIFTVAGSINCKLVVR